MVKNILGSFRANWQAIALSILLAGSLTGLYLYRLGAHVRGDSVFESQEFLGINGLEAIFQDVAFAPHKFLELIMVKIDDPNATLLRLLSVAIIALATLAMFLLLKKWHTSRVAIITAVLFATSSYSLHLGRFSHVETMMYLALPALLLMGTWLKSKRTVGRLPIVLGLAALLLYIPGIWAVLSALAIIFRKRLLLAWRYVTPLQRWIGSVSFVAITTPLLYGLVNNSSQITRLIGVDKLFEEGVKVSAAAVADIPGQLVFNGSDESYRWLAGTPILEIGSVVLFILGVYSYIRGHHPLRARLLGGLIVFCVVLIGISSFNAMSLLMPVIYIVIACGVAFLLQSWFTVFPKNPAARTVAVIVMIIVSGFIANYHIQRYFEAWPNAPATERALASQDQE